MLQNFKELNFNTSFEANEETWKKAKTKPKKDSEIRVQTFD